MIYHDIKSRLSGERKVVLFFISSLRAGGAERVIANLAGQLSRYEFDVVLVTLHKKTAEDYPLDESVSRIDLDCIHSSPTIFHSALNNVKRLLLLRRVFKQIEPDVAISFLTSSNVIAIVAKIGLSIPLIVSERIYPAASDASRAWLMARNLLYGFADSVIVQSRASKDWIEKHTRSKQVRVIPNSVTWPPKLYGDVLPVSSIVGQPRKFILGVGRLCEQKGFHYLINAFSAIAAKIPDYDLVIIGGGSSDQYKELPGYKSNEDRIHFTGHVGNIEDWYSAASIYVLSSIFEGFPNSLAEAMAGGCAVISADCQTGPSDLIEHEVNGLLVPVGDSHGLSRAIESLANDEAKRDALSVNSVLVQDKYSDARINDLWLDAIDNTLGCESPREKPTRDDLVSSR